MGELKRGWQKVKFGDIAQCVNDRVDDPKAAGVERYVGLEHLDPESLSIRRWGTPDDVESTKLRFKPGDIIFGKRRAYQRKLAVADFEGICSAHAMVLRAKPGAVVPEFLPYFMQSDVFMERAVAISVGSLSPTINWKTLAEEAFALPPMEEQRRIVPALAAASSYSAQVATVAEKAKILLRATLTSLFELPRIPRRDLLRPARGWRLSTLAELADPKRPISYGVLMPGDSTPDGVPMLRVVDIDEFGRRTQTEVLRVARSVADTSATTYCRTGDLVVSVMATIGRTMIVPEHMDGWNMNRALTLVPCVDVRTARFLHAYFQTGFVQALLGAEKIGSAQPRINLADLRTLPVPVPNDLDRVLGQSAALFSTLECAEARAARARQLADTLVSEVLS